MSRFWAVLLTLTLAASIVFDLFAPPKEVYHLWDRKGFFAVFGFVGCIAIIFISKALGKYWLQRMPAYYEPYHAPEAGAPAGAHARAHEEGAPAPGARAPDSDGTEGGGSDA